MNTIIILIVMLTTVPGSKEIFMPPCDCPSSGEFTDADYDKDCTISTEEWSDAFKDEPGMLELFGPTDCDSDGQVTFKEYIYRISNNIECDSERLDASINITIVTPDGNKYEIKKRKVLWPNHAAEEQSGDWGFSYGIEPLSADEYVLSLRVFEKIKTDNKVNWQVRTTGKTKGRFGSSHDYELESNGVRFTSSIFVTVVK